MERPFPAYKGDEPYIFVSYSHEDSDIVFPSIQWLRDQGFNIWYDEGISPGASWREELAESMLGCDLFIILISPRSANSDNCLKEVNYALEHDRPVLAIHQEPTQLSPGLELALSDRQAIFRYELTEEEYREKVLSGVRSHLQQGYSTGSVTTSPVINTTAKPIVIGAGLIAIAILAVGILFYMKPGGDTDALSPTAIEDQPATQKAVAEAVEQKISIAVLPFVNMSNDPDNEYFSDGISEEILNTLVKTGELPVIARTSSFQFKGQNLDVQKIGRQLNVSHLVEGSVRKSGNRVRITAQLIDATDGTHLWSESYDRELTDIFAIQDEIAWKIVDEIGFAITNERFRLPQVQSRGTRNTAAFETYLQAKHFANSDNPYEIEKAIPLFEQALSLDREFADAWVDLGRTYIALAENPFNLRIPAETNPIAIEAFEKALQIEPMHARALGYLGFLRISNDYQWNEGIKLLEQSIALSPQDAELQALYGYILYATRHEEAKSVLDKAYRLNPFDNSVILLRAVELMGAGRRVDGITLIDTMLIQNRERFDASILAAMVNVPIQLDKAEEYLGKARNVVGPDYAFVRLLDWAIAFMKNDLDLAEEIKAELKNRARHSRVGNLLSIYWEEDEIVEMLDIAVNQRGGEMLPLLLGNKPNFVPQSDWDRIQQTTRTAEAKIGKAAYGWLRSDKEKQQLLTASSSLSDSELDFYVGVFKEQDRSIQIRVERNGDQLELVNRIGRKSPLVPTGNNRFELIEGKTTIVFDLNNEQVVGLRLLQSQITFDYVKM